MKTWKHFSIVSITLILILSACGEGLAISNSPAPTGGASAPESNSFLYVSDNSAQFWKCPLNTNGSFTQSTCTAETNSTAPYFNSSQASTFGTFSGHLYGYFSDDSNQIWKCAIDASGDISGGCTAFPGGGVFNQILSVTIQSFSGTPYLFVADYSSNIWKCPLTANGDLTTCTNAYPSFNLTFTVTFQSFSGTNYAFVSDASSNLYKCTLTASGDFAACLAMTNSTAPHFGQTIAVTFQNFSGTTYAYVGDSTSNIWKCTLDASGTISGGCVAMTNSPAFAYTDNVTFYTTNESTDAYFGDGLASLWKCPLDTTDGSFYPCTAIPGFNSTQGETLLGL